MNSKEPGDFKKTGIGFLIISPHVTRIMKSGLLDRFRDLMRSGSELRIKKSGDEKS